MWDCIEEILCRKYAMTYSGQKHYDSCNSLSGCFWRYLKLYYLIVHALKMQTTDNSSRMKSEFTLHIVCYNFREK